MLLRCSMSIVRCLTAIAVLGLIIAVIAGFCMSNRDRSLERIVKRKVKHFLKGMEHMACDANSKIKP